MVYGFLPVHTSPLSVVSKVCKLMHEIQHRCSSEQYVHVLKEHANGLQCMQYNIGAWEASLLQLVHVLG